MIGIFIEERKMAQNTTICTYHDASIKFTKIVSIILAVFLLIVGVLNIVSFFILISVIREFFG